MSALFTSTGVYGNATLYFDPDGRIPTAGPTGPNLVRFMMGGRGSLLTVNNSNLAAPVVSTYQGGFSSGARFLPGNFFTGGQAVVLLRTGPRAQVMRMGMTYPT